MRRHIETESLIRGDAPPRGSRRGAIAILLALSSLGILAMGGLVTDLGRIYIAKNELQNFTDSAALAAVARLNGSASGLSDATAEAAANANRWNFDTEAVDSPTVEFATAIGGPYATAPASATGIRFVRVSAQADVSLYLTQVLPGVGNSSSLDAVSVAGLVGQNSRSDGIFPYSPDARNPADPNFGFLLGKLYTLKYDKATTVSATPSPTTFLLTLNDKKVIGCPADMEAAPTFRPGFAGEDGGTSLRGYIDLSDRIPGVPGGGTTLIRDTMLGRMSFTYPITIGYSLTMEPGNKSALQLAFMERVAQDTDGAPGAPRQTPSYYTTTQTAMNTPAESDMNNFYRSAYETGYPRPPDGNGRRLVSVPINDGMTIRSSDLEHSSSRWSPARMWSTKA